MSSHYIKFIELLNKCRIDRAENNNIFTHTSLGNPFGCFNITDKEREKFNDFYSKVVNENKHAIYLTEKHRKQGPILIDLDFKYYSDSDVRIINDFHYNVLIEEYIKNIIKYIKLDDIEDLKCYVLTKPRPTSVAKDVDARETLYKDGVHIIFPNICTEPLVQHLIRENVIKYITENNSWSDLSLNNDIEEFNKTQSIIYSHIFNNYQQEIIELRKLVIYFIKHWNNV